MSQLDFDQGGSSSGLLVDRLQLPCCLNIILLMPVGLEHSHFFKPIKISCCEVQATVQGQRTSFKSVAAALLGASLYHQSKVLCLIDVLLRA
jgi:hypothetical protein